MAIDNNSPQFSHIDMEKLASNIRAAGRGESHFKIQTKDRPPAIGRIHMAVEGGHISEEEGRDLNPKYDPSKKKHNQIMASNVRKHEKNPEGTRKKLREEYYRRKARKQGTNGGS